MPSVIGVLALAAGAFWLDGPGLIRRKLWKELAFFIVYLLAGTSLFIALVLEVRLPNPLDILKLMYGGLG